jgi:hypothetical protein
LRGSPFFQTIESIGRHLVEKKFDVLREREKDRAELSPRLEVDEAEKWSDNDDGEDDGAGINGTSNEMKGDESRQGTRESEVAGLIGDVYACASALSTRMEVLMKEFESDGNTHSEVNFF